MMRKIALIGAMLVLSCGCSTCWRPFRGALCNRTPLLPAAVTASGGCNDCQAGYSAGYSTIDGEVVGGSGYYGSDAYYGGEVTQEGVASPSMVTPAK